MLNAAIDALKQYHGYEETRNDREIGAGGDGTYAEVIPMNVLIVREYCLQCFKRENRSEVGS